MTTAIRVLLVEDNPGDADLTRETLRASRLHMDIDLAVDGAEALARLTHAPPYEAAPLPDLVLLDLNLPKIDGLDVLRAVRARPEIKHLPIVVLTSSDAESDVMKSYRVGANCYVTKPVGLDAFQTIVRTIEDFWFTVVRLP